MLSWGEFNISLATEEDWAPPEFAGSMLRGAFGHALKNVVCAMRLRECEGCPLVQCCIYSTLFDTRPSADAAVMTRYRRVPHPFVLSVAMANRDIVPAGNEISLGFRLLGSALAAAPFCLRAWEEAAGGGLTRKRIPFRMERVCQRGPPGGAWRPGQPYPQAAPQPVPDPLPTRPRLALTTPLRLTSTGRLLTPETFSAQAFCMALVRRLGLLSGFYGAAEHGLDFQELKVEAGSVSLVTADLKWHRLFRHSSRQHARQSIGGIIGNLTLDLSSAPSMRKLLAWAPIIHMGKGTSMGLGRVELVP